MLRTFNLGVGLTVVCRPENKDEIIKHVKANGINAYEIGKIVKGQKQVDVVGEFNW